MGNDNLFYRRKQIRLQRISKEMNLRAETWLIICEGTKTEPNYFKSLFEYVNKTSANKINVKICGEGKNTTSLINSVEKYFDYYDHMANKSNIKYGKVFIVFDKDDFSNKAFNDSIDICKRKGYVALWSNECIELWFVLHFEYLQSKIKRSQYMSKLSKLLNKEYVKNDNHFFNIDSINKIKTAYKNAVKLVNLHVNEKSYSNKKPCTTIYKLIDEINDYVNKDIFNVHKSSNQLL